MLAHRCISTISLSELKRNQTKDRGHVAVAYHGIDVEFFTIESSNNS